MARISWVHLRFPSYFQRMEVMSSSFCENQKNLDISTQKAHILKNVKNSIFKYAWIWRGDLENRNIWKASGYNIAYHDHLVSKSVLRSFPCHFRENICILDWSAKKSKFFIYRDIPAVFKNNNPSRLTRIGRIRNSFGPGVRDKGPDKNVKK